MPHCCYQDAAVEELYRSISDIAHDTRFPKRILLIAGAWDAEVKSDTLGCSKNAAASKYANPLTNARGELLKRWATSEQLVLANAHFQKRWGLRLTHYQNGRRR